MDVSNSVLSGLSREMAKYSTMRGSSVEHTDPRLFHDKVHDLLQVPGLVVNLELAVGAAAHLQHLVDVVNLVARSQFVDNVVDQVQIFEHQSFDRYFFLFAEVDELAFQPVTACAKLVFADQRAAVNAVALVGRMQLPQHGSSGLNQRGDCQRLVQPHGKIAHSHFDCLEEWMRPDVPPYLLTIVDAVRLHQQIDERFVVGPVGEHIRYPSPREAFEHLTAIRFESGLHAHPERRVGGEGEDVRQEVSHRIHDVDRGIAVLDADVNMQSKHQVGALHQLHVLDDLAIALVRINLLHFPVGKRMGARGPEQQAVLLGQRDHLAPQVSHVFAGFLDVAADLGANLHHRLVHLGLYMFRYLQFGLGEDLHLDMRAEVSCLRVDRLVFLFDSDAQAWPLHVHYPLVALFGALTDLAALGAASTLTSAILPLRKAFQRYSDTLPVCSLAFRTASSATASTIQWKLSSPTELMSASGAGFMKSMAYGIPASQANSTVLRS